MPNHELDRPAELVREKFHPLCLWRSESWISAPAPPSLFVIPSIVRGQSWISIIRDKFHPACPASAITCVRQVLVLHIGKPV
jgi:hypothetical protein